MKNCIVLLLLFVVGCAVEPKIPAGPSGNVSGTAILYDSFGKMLPSSAGITVSVTASGISKSVSTNDSGKWTLAGLPRGIYTLTFTKEGFGTMKVFDFHTEGKDTISREEVDMTEPSFDRINFQRFTISESSLDSIASYNIIGAMQMPFLQMRSVVLCISADSAALADDPNSAPVLLSFSIAGSGYDGGFNWSSTNSSAANNNSFAHGSKLYATVCIYGEGPDGEYLSNYFDPESGRQSFTALGRHSQILSAVMP
jgi:hypothetical protein